MIGTGEVTVDGEALADTRGRQWRLRTQTWQVCAPEPHRSPETLTGRAGGGLELSVADGQGRGRALRMLEFGRGCNFVTQRFVEPVHAPGAWPDGE